MTKAVVRIALASIIFCVSVAMAGCAQAETDDESAAATAPDRDGFSGQMGVYVEGVE